MGMVCGPLQLVENGGSRELRASHREPQAVARHRIDETRRITREHAAGDPARRCFDGQRSETDRRCRLPGMREPVAQQVFVADRVEHGGDGAPDDSDV